MILREVPRNFGTAFERTPEGVRIPVLTKGRKAETLQTVIFVFFLSVSSNGCQRK